jgi:hypothetical protein
MGRILALLNRGERCHGCGHPTAKHGPRLAPGCLRRRCSCELDWKGDHIVFDFEDAD